ncbi:MAG: DUF2203 domain-containing protein [Acidobacteriota bacterium]|nr:DUF2203 domain-containing protein [Acidobacteriota bacterium]
MPKYFTLLEAETLLPELENLLRSCVQGKQDYDGAEEELRSVATRITLNGGMVIVREQVAEVRVRKDSAARTIKSSVEKIEQIGCHIKDLNLGLLDFPTLYRDQEVYLCWKLGESGIGFWHHVDDGFSGRQPVNAEFLANHRGSPVS